MKKSTGKVFYLKLSLVAACAVVAFFGFYGLSGMDRSKAFSTGPSASRTGAPGEGDCSTCHLGEPINTQGGDVKITGLPVNYRPGQQYPVTVTVDHFNANVYGFQMTSIDKTGLQSGTFQLPTLTPPQLQIKEGIVGGNARSYVEHTVNGITSATPNTRSWTFNWTAPATRKGKVTFYAAGNGGNGDGDSTGDNIYTSNTGTYAGTAVSSFDGDGKTDVAVFRPSTGTFYSLNTTDGGFRGNVFGGAGDRVVPGDYDGDGKADVAVWRPSNGVWYVIKSSDGGIFGNSFGASTDLPVQGDYDGDGKTDIAVYRPSTGTWYILQSGNGQVRTYAFGLSTDKPTQADYDADGKADLAIFRPSNGEWYILRSADSSLLAFQFGANGDKPVQGDYDGDGKSDAAIYRPSNGVWYILKSSDGGIAGNSFGNSTDIPVPGDYDGDGFTDLAVYRDGTWYILPAGASSFQVQFFGSAGDIPLPSGYNPQ